MHISGFDAQRSIYLANATTDDTAVVVKVHPSSRLVRVEWGERFYSSPLVTSRISGNVQGNTTLPLTLVQGQLNITNNLGEVYIVQ